MAWAWGPLNQAWLRTSVWVSDIEETSTATKVMALAVGAPGEMGAIWNRMMGNARTCRCAEQDPFTAFTSWPRSLSKSFQTNSNTFVSEMLRALGITMVEMSMPHPGNTTASENTEGHLGFSPLVPPWKTGNGPPPPNGRP